MLKCRGRQLTDKALLIKLRLLSYALQRLIEDSSDSINLDMAFRAANRAAHTVSEIVPLARQLADRLEERELLRIGREMKL
jgi:hypothetical protein